MVLDLPSGGHLTHGSPVNLSGKLFNFINYELDQNEVIVIITQNLVKSKKEDGTDTRLAEVKNAILSLDNKVTAQEKKSKSLNEQLVSVRTYLKTQKAPKSNDT